MQPNKSSSQTRYSEIWFPEGFRWIDYTTCNPWNIFCERYLSPLTTTFETFCFYVINNYDILPQFCDCHIYIVVTKANLWANWILEIIMKAQLCFHKISIIHQIIHTVCGISALLAIQDMFTASRLQILKRTTFHCNESYFWWSGVGWAMNSNRTYKNPDRLLVNENWLVLFILQRRDNG